MTTSGFISQARTFLLVGLVTALIWLLAEAESLRTEKIRVEVFFRAKPDSGRLVRVEPGQDFTGSAAITIEGPTAEVDTLASRARAPIEFEPGMDAVPADPGRHTISLADALRAHPLFRDSQVSITAVDPPAATVRVDAIVNREVPVRVEMPEGVLLEGLPEPTPALVTVRMSEALASGSPDIQAVARITAEALANLPEGRRVTVRGVAVSLPPFPQGESARVSPAQVDVALILRTRTSSTVVASVPVHLRLAPTEIGRWDIDIPPEGRVLTDVTVTGPAELVEQVRTERVRLIAYIPLSFEELERAAANGQAIEKEVVFSDLPTTLRFEARQKAVRLTVSPRAGG